MEMGQKVRRATDTNKRKEKDIVTYPLGPITAQTSPFVKVPETFSRIHFLFPFLPAFNVSPLKYKFPLSLMAVVFYSTVAICRSYIMYTSFGKKEGTDLKNK